MNTFITVEKNDRIMIGDKIVVTIVSVGDEYSSQKVRIGVDAPREISVMRGELVKR